MKTLREFRSQYSINESASTLVGHPSFDNHNYTLSTNHVHNGQNYTAHTHIDDDGDLHHQIDDAQGNAVHKHHTYRDWDTGRKVAAPAYGKTKVFDNDDHKQIFADHKKATKKALSKLLDESYDVQEDLKHATDRYHLQNKVYNMRASASARANPNTTRTSPEEHERLSNKALRSFELRKKKTDTLQKAQAADRKANPPKSDPDYEYNVRYPKGHVAGD